MPDVEHTGLSAAELEHLLALRPGHSAAAMAALLQLDGAERAHEHGDSLITGAASLLNRGFARVTETGGIEIVGTAHPISRILTSAERWTVFAVRDDAAGANGFLVESPEGKLIAQPRGIGSWLFMLLHPTAVTAQIVTQTALGLARSSDSG